MAIMRRQWSTLDAILSARSGPTYPSTEPSELTIAKFVWSVVQENIGWTTDHFCEGDPLETAMWWPSDVAIYSLILLQIEEKFELPKNCTEFLCPEFTLGNLVQLISRHIEGLP